MSWSRFFRRKQWDRERARELEAYLEIEADENIARGVSAEQARQAARRKLGNSTLIREEIYGMNSIRFFETLWQDVRYGVRTLANSRAFSFVVIASLALGIGANTAIFSLIDAALLKMLPVKDPEQLVQFKGVTPRGLTERFSYPGFKEFRDRNQVFSGVLAFATIFFDVNIEVNRQGGVAKGQVVSGNYFSALGIKPAIGRLIAPADERVAGQSPVAVIGYDYWRRRFALDPAVIGEKIVLNNSPYTVIGVTPSEFFGLQPGEKIDVSVPITMMGQMNPGFAQIGTRYDVLTSHINSWLYVMARLKPGVAAPKEALANLEPLFRANMREAAEGLHGTPYDSPAIRNSFLQAKLQLDSAGEGLAALRRRFSRPLWVLMAVVGLLLLVTCANVANLLLARANARRKEIAVRLTIGAGHWRMIRQLLTESALLALCGCAAGLLLAFWGSGWLLTMMSHSNSPISLRIRPDATVLGFTLLISLLTALLFGLVPAWRAVRLNPASSMVEITRSSGTAGARSRLGKMLIVLQVAVSLVLLIGAGLLTRSLENLKNFYPGFNKENVLLLTIHPMTVGYNDARAALLYRRLLDQIGGIPGVRSATFSFYSPLGVFGSTLPKIKEVTSQSGKDTKPAGIDVVGPDYFKTLQTPVLSGRDFTAADRAEAPKVAIVNKAMAHDYFGDTNPLGKHVSAPGWDPGWFAIVGVVQDGKTRSLREQTVPMIYLPLYQAPEGLATFEVRTAISPLSVADAVRRVVKATDSRIPVYGVKTLDEQVNQSLIQERLVAWLSSLFGLLALLLAAVGLYGLMTYAVNRRTGEIGIRMALGAARRQIAGMILRETLQLVLIGLAIGIPAAIAAARLIESELYGLKSDDPMTLLVAISIMTTIAVLAAYLPARRASRVEPMVALRME